MSVDYIFSRVEILMYYNVINMIGQQLRDAV